MTEQERRVRAWASALVARSGGTDYYHEGWATEADIVTATLDFLKAEELMTRA